MIEEAIQKIRTLAEEANGPTEIAPEERRVYVTFDGKGDPHYQSARKLLAEYDTRPRHRQGTATFEDLESFIRHANRFKGESSALFASRSGAPTLTSVIDYHDAGPEPTDGDLEGQGRARFGKHRGVYRFPLADEWRAWTGVKADLSQADFAAFLESRVLDIIDPKRAGDGLQDLLRDLGGLALASPSRILELSRGLAVRVNAKVATAVSLASGEAQFSYATEHQDAQGAPLKVPSAFAIVVPVFERGEAFQLLVRLRYRVSQGAVTWTIAVHNADKALAIAFEGACEEAQAKTELPLFFGTPE